MRWLYKRATKPAHLQLVLHTCANVTTNHLCQKKKNGKRETGWREVFQNKGIHQVSRNFQPTSWRSWVTNYFVSPPVEVESQQTRTCADTIYDTGPYHKDTRKTRGLINRSQIRNSSRVSREEGEGKERMREFGRLLVVYNYPWSCTRGNPSGKCHIPNKKSNFPVNNRVL